MPKLLEIYCLECGTSGGMDQVFHVLFNPVSDDGDDDDDDDDFFGNIGDIFNGGDDGDKEEEDDGYFAEQLEKHVRRAFVSYHVTEEIKIREQLEVISPAAADLYCNIPLLSVFKTPLQMSCGTAYTIGALQWEPGAALVDKKDRAKAVGPKKPEDKKAGAGKQAWGYTVWPVDIGIYASFNFGLGTSVNL